MDRAPKPKQTTARIKWVFRISGISQNDVESCERQGWELQEEITKYASCAAFQLESAPTTGYLHFQGSVHFINKQRYEWIQKRLGPFEYLMPQKGNNLQAWSYGSKEDTRVLGPWFIGECPPDSGKKRDYAKFIKAAEDGNFAQIKEESPDLYCLYYGTMRRIHNDVPIVPPDLDHRCGSWFWGPPNSGKTTGARSIGKFFSKRPNINWDGYVGEPIVIVDDIDASHQYILRDLKIWGDRFAFQGKILYSNIWLRPLRIIVTSNVPISKIFTDPVHAAAVRSRYPETEFFHDPTFTMTPEEKVIYELDQFKKNFIM